MAIIALVSPRGKAQASLKPDGLCRRGRNIGRSAARRSSHGLVGMADYFLDQRAHRPLGIMGSWHYLPRFAPDPGSALKSLDWLGAVWFMGLTTLLQLGLASSLLTTPRNVGRAVGVSLASILLSVTRMVRGLGPPPGHANPLYP